MSTLIEKARAMFPHVPTEVFQVYMEPLILSDGWPFTRISDRNNGTVWYQYLSGISLELFSHLLWDRNRLLITKDVLHLNSYSDINRIVDEHINGIT